MILSKTPLRISFSGGGSDYFNPNSDNPGRVIVTTINKYMYVCLNKKYNNDIRAAYSLTENVRSTKDLKHDIIRESLNYHKIYNGVEITTLADIPSSGSGLASSSALAVGLSNAIRKYKDLNISKKLIADDACKVEIERCKKPIGMQDQYSTAYGGLNRIEFFNNKKVKVTKLKINKYKLDKINENLMLFYTGINRKADEILKKISLSGKKFKNHDRLSNLALDFEKELISGDMNKCAEILHEGWILKRNLNSAVSSIKLNEIYDAALRAGSKGGKILGAGGGGYFLFVAEKKNHKKIKKALKKLEYIDFKFISEGSQVIRI